MSNSSYGHKWKRHGASYKEEAGSRHVRMKRRKVAQLSEAQGHRCAYCCGETFLHEPEAELPKGMSWKQRATLEHLIPRSDPQQTNKDENLVMACSKCNCLRGNYSYMDFFRTIRRVRVEQLPPKKKVLTPKRIEELKAKEGRTLAYCLICWRFWPEDAAYLAEHWRPRIPHNIYTRKRPYLIAMIAKIVTADPRRMAA